MFILFSVDLVDENWAWTKKATFKAKRCQESNMEECLFQVLPESTWVWISYPFFTAEAAFCRSILSCNSTPIILLLVLPIELCPWWISPEWFSFLSATNTTTFIHLLSLRKEVEKKRKRSPKKEMYRYIARNTKISLTLFKKL